MNLTNAEKLTLAMICEIHTELKLNAKGYDSKLIRSAIETGNTWAIPWQYSDVLEFEDEIEPPELAQVTNVMEMWEFLEEGFKALTPHEKGELAEKAQTFGRDVKFGGFDGNNESTFWSIANFLVNKMALFQRFDGRDLNSHVPSMASYQRMYEVFKPWLENYPHRTLNVDELADILNARRNPLD